MTGYTVHTGSSEKFADGWDRIFKQSKKQKTKRKSAKKSPSPKAKVKKSQSR